MAQLKLETFTKKPELVSQEVPRNDYVEKATISLVREYLYKKGFKSSLKCLNHEEGSFAGSQDRRAALAKELKLESLMRKNKLVKINHKNNSSLLEKPLMSMLEVLVKEFVCQGQVRSKNKSKETQTLLENSAVHHIAIQTDLSFDLEEKYTRSRQRLLDNISSNSGSQEDLNNSEAEERHKNMEFGSKSSKNPSKFSRTNSKSEAEESSSSSSSSYQQEPLKSPPSSISTNSGHGFDNQFKINTKTRIKQKSPNSEENKLALLAGTGRVNNFLQSKQNALAQMCLTQEENEDRNETNAANEALEDMDDEVKGHNNAPEVNKSREIEEMELRDIEDEDFGLSDTPSDRNGGVVYIRNPGRNNGSINSNKTRLDVKNWRDLKIAVLGPNGYLQEGWIGQGFNFSQQIPYGFVQNMGGPCGVLAVMQALVIRNLMFGSEFCDDTLPGFELYTILNKQSTQTEQQEGNKALVSKRSAALAGALVEILWRCGNKSEGHKVKLCLQGNEPGSEVVEIQRLEDLKDFVKQNLYQFDCIGLLYSAVLSRGIDQIQEDMDFPNSPLLGQHGYCSQELVNLLLFGKCISNAFDDQVKLDEKVLQGIEAQSDIGLLSLFEHYGSCEVGSYLKNPRFPVWIVCSESHFSCLFSLDKWLTFPSDKVPVFQKTKGFDLFYYDGLAHQSHIIRLTISFDEPKEDRGFLSIPNGFAGRNQQKPEEIEDNLIPPLDKCIRTKWKNALVFWNDTEPIL